MVQHRHILLVTFPAQGHINPGLQFAKRLIKMGVEVTFVTSIFAHRRIAAGIPEGINLASFSDGYDDGFKRDVDDAKHFLSEIRARGSETLKEIISTSAEQGRPVTCLIYTFFLPWAAEVARSLQVPSALLWIQPAAVLDIYYFYFYGYEEAIKNSCNNDPSSSIQLPGLPLLHARDIPSFLLPSSSETYSFTLPTFEEQLDILEAQTNPKVLVNSFHSLETDALKAIDKFDMIPVGPLIPSAFLDGKDPSDTSFGGDLFRKSKDYIDWLNSKPEGSIVYISFGSILMLPKPQLEEIACGLLKSGRPFLWVIKKKENNSTEEEEETLSCMEELEQQGMIVPWCSQLEVLSHKSLGCFMTHCGWNSTLESLVFGVPMVAFPQWADQGTNAKLIEVVWKTGVRVRPDEEGMVDSDEIYKCLEMVMGDGERSEEFRSNAKKWKGLAREAMEDGGSSNENLKAFVEEVGQGFEF